MARFSVQFGGYPRDIIAMLGISANNFVRKLTGERAYVKLGERVDASSLRSTIVTNISVCLWRKPGYKAELSHARRVAEEKYGREVDAFIDQHREDLAEIMFLREDQGES